MTSPQVSVILPTHNRSALLSRAVHSVLEQTYSDLELIVVDDGSTDGTRGVAQSIDDPRLMYVRLDRQRGAAAARNAGLRRARGPFVAFQDSDDEWLPGKLSGQVALIEEGGAQFGAVGGRYLIDGGDRTDEVGAPALEAGHDYEADLLDGHCCIMPVWLIRREVLDRLGAFDERLPCLEDWDLMLRVSEQTRMRALRQPVIVKHGAPNSLGWDLGLRREAMEALLERYRGRFLAHRSRHASYCLELAYLSLLCGYPRQMLRFVAAALRDRTVPPRVLLAFAEACARAKLLHRPAWPPPGFGHSR